jgi:hypothetical protein
MTTLASGGNAMASPPDPPPPSLTPGYGGDKGILSNCNPSGNRSDMNSGAPANMTASTSPYVSMASLIKPSSGMAGMHQDTYVTGQSASMFIQESLDVEELLAAVSGASLSSCQEHGTPCHKPFMDNDHMEASSQESPTIIPSAPMTPLPSEPMTPLMAYQMTKNPKEKVQQLIQTMMSMDDKLYIDPFYTDTPKTSRVILALADIPMEDKYFAWYFVDMHDPCNKAGMTLLCWNTTMSNGIPSCLWS